MGNFPMKYREKINTKTEKTTKFIKSIKYVIVDHEYDYIYICTELNFETKIDRHKFLFDQKNDFIVNIDDFDKKTSKKIKKNIHLFKQVYVDYGQNFCKTSFIYV